MKLWGNNMKIIKAVFMIIVLFLFGCTKTKNVNKNLDIIVNIGPETQSIDPTLNNTVDGSVYIVHAFEGLATKDKENKIIPGAAEKWEISEDGLTYTFHIRSNAKWSDGKEVTAEDFVYTWQRAVDPLVASEYSYQFESVKNAKAITESKKGVKELGVKALNEKTLEVTLESPTAYFLELTAYPTYFPVRKDIIEKYKDEWTKNPETYIGNGPFKMKERKPDEKIVMEKNENYWNIKEIIPNSVTFVLMNSPTSSVAAIKDGSLHYSEKVPSLDIENLKEEGLLKIANRLGTYFYGFNNTNTYLKDPKIRKALSLAIDRNYIVEQVSKRGIPSDGIVPFGILDIKGDFRDNAKSHYSLDKKDYAKNIEEAKRLMAEAGYSNGKDFPVLEIISDNADNVNILIAETVQEMWKKNLNIDAVIRQEEWAIYLDTILNNKNFAVAKDSWSGDYNDPMTFLGMFLSYSPQNTPIYSNSAYDNYLKTAMNTMDQNIRMEAMHKAEDTFMSDMGVIPIYYFTTPILMNPKLKNVVLDPLGMTKFFYAYIEE